MDQTSNNESLCTKNKEYFIIFKKIFQMTFFQFFEQKLKKHSII